HPAPTATYTLSLHDALPISLSPANAAFPDDAPSLRAATTALIPSRAILPADKALLVYPEFVPPWPEPPPLPPVPLPDIPRVRPRSEEHTSELQSRENLVCRL